VSIFCEANQLTTVYAGFIKHDYICVDPIPYVMDSDMEATTLADKRATDAWGVHPILIQRTQGGVPFATPFGLIVTARRDNTGKQHSQTTCLFAPVYTYTHTCKTHTPIQMLTQAQVHARTMI
jgi:hypothetical protein